MSNAHKLPDIQHVPAGRAQGLDDDVTAQPRPISDELALEDSAEPELSVDPEDMGSRFLSDAVEQGDPESRTRGALDPQREAAVISDFYSALDELDDNGNDGDRRSSPRIRAVESDVSLLDREGDEADDTIASELDFDEQGSHTHLAAGSEPEPRVKAEARPSTMRPKAQLKAAARTALHRGVGLLRRIAGRLQQRAS